MAWQSKERKEEAYRIFLHLWVTIDAAQVADPTQKSELLRTRYIDVAELTVEQHTHALSDCENTLIKPEQIIPKTELTLCNSRSKRWLSKNRKKMQQLSLEVSIQTERKYSS